MIKYSEDASIYRDLVRLAISSVKEWLPNKGEHFYSFSSSLDFEYRDNFFSSLNDDEQHELFGSVIHSMPDSHLFSVDVGKQLWKEYEKIFYCGMIADEAFDDNSWKIYKSENVDVIKAYESFFEIQEELELELLNAKSVAEENLMIAKLSKNSASWLLSGYKREVENEKNKYFSKGEYSFANQWSTWKANADNTVASGEKNLYGNYEISMPGIGIDDNIDFGSITIPHAELIKTFPERAIGNSELHKMVKDISQLRINYKIIDVVIPGFERSVFESEWWKFKPQYKGGVSIPSIVKKIVIIDKVDYLYRTKNVFEAGVRIFTAGLPKYQRLLKAKSGMVILVGFICERLPKVPNTNFTKYKFSQ